MPPLPPVTQFLMLLCTAVFCIQLLLPIDGWLALWTLRGGRFLPWQPLTYAFLHRDFLHLFFNMFGLWMFGAELERLWGTRRYLQFLLACALSGAAGFLLVGLLMGAIGRGVGASAALYGLLAANAMLFPERPIMLIIPPVQLKMKVFVLGFAVITALLSLSQGMTELAYLAGMLGGYLMILYWRGRPPFGGRGPKRRLH